MLQESHITSSSSRRTGPHTRQSRTLFEVLSTPRRTPSQLEALLHSTKNSHTIRGPSSRQEELPPMRGPSSLQKDSQCARGPSSMNNPPTKRLMSQQTQERHITAGEQQHQSSSSSIKLFM